MKVNFFFLILFLSSISVAIAQGSTVEQHLKKFKNRYSLGKEITSKDDLPYGDAIANLIDTTFILNYKLVDISWGKELPTYQYTRIKKLYDYRCEHVGHYKTKKGILLFSKSQQSGAGSGNPTLTLTSIDQNGNLLDNVQFGWELEYDEGLEEKMIFSISTDFNIKHDQIRIDYKFENEKKVILKTTAVSTIYSLTEDGHFKIKEK
jgi:hypothetical protein